MKPTLEEHIQSEWTRVKKKFEGIRAGTEINWSPSGRQYTKREVNQMCKVSFEQWMEHQTRQGNADLGYSILYPKIQRRKRD